MRKMTLMTVAVMLGAFALSANADAAAWRKCQACHNFNATNKMGPGLADVIGRKAGSEPGFRYTFAKYIKGDGWVWDEAHLREFMCDSKKAIRKFTGDPKARTAMPAQRVCKAAQQDEVLAKLKSISK
jgi:cytochrome c